MSTTLLYQTNSYLREFDATVMAVDAEQGRVALDRTAFYPGGGGQPHDRGQLGAWQVTKVKKEAGTVWHWLSGDGLPAVGDTLHGELDWERRYALMRTHTALHILCGVVWRDYGAQVTGGNMEPGKGRMDFEFASLHKDLVGEIEAKCNTEVAAARPVHVKILPRAAAFQIPDLIRTKINLLPPGIQEIRTVALEGLDLQADGGTHVANTSEVGGIEVVNYKSKGAINKRIYIALRVPAPGALAEA
ncbi:MAG: alanyl-tRNA editing protein [Chloroflexi bacterium]|nr:alanyl-tRNA editing protein [Chloroflexota bacterium]